MPRPSLLFLLIAALPTLAQADGLFDAVKQAANSEVGKTVSSKAVEATKGAVGKSVTGKVEKELNDRLLAEARKNQCSFKTDSDELEPGCDAKAKKLALTMIDVKKKLTGLGISAFKFEVSGHTDSRGAADHNKQLSAKRAAAIVKQLAANGVPSDEIISVGYGSERPLVKPDNTPAKQAKNRRYELRVRL
jgi:outer membrane protein OmpA-like peptidoglycan-associated protein